MPPERRNVQGTLSHRIRVTRRDALRRNVRANEVRSILLRRREENVPLWIHTNR